MKRTITLLALLLAISTAAFAHGKEKHILGTVSSTSDTSITIQTTKNETVTVHVVTKTKFIKSGSAAISKDLAVGDKVVVHAEERDGKLVANQVRFGATSKKPAKMP